MSTAAPQPPAARAPLALRTLAAAAGAKLLLHLLAVGQYGYFRDELYYLACTEHLSWGYVDMPPLSIAVLGLVRATLGDSLVALRAVPVLAGIATMVLVALIARRLGGGRFAQSLAALAVLAAPVFLGEGRSYSMNALDQLCWALAMLLLLRALQSASLRDWAALGLVLGLGLLNKTSVLWLGGGIVVGLLLTPERRVLRRAGPWVAAGLALALFLPFLAWQARHEWPMLEFMRNATAVKMVPLSPPAFLLDQVLHMNAGGAPVWIAGLILGLAGGGSQRAQGAQAAQGPLGAPGAEGRVFAWIYLAVLALLLAAGSARASYLAPAYCGLLALGGVALERLTAQPGRRGWRVAIVALTAAGGLVTVPLALPVLPVETFVRYQAALGVEPRTEERHAMGALPQHYADMFGWEEMAALAAQAYGRLTPDEQRRCRIFGQNYGEAGAIDVLGRRLGLPRALSGHNSYWIWGPGDAEWDVLIVIGGDREDNAEFFDEIEIVGQTASPWAMPYERGLDVSIARRPKMTLREAWPRLRRFI